MVQSNTVTSKEHLAVWPPVLVAEQFTVVVPGGNSEPGCGSQTTGTDPHAPAAAISRLVRMLAIVNGIVLSSLAALLIRYGWKGLRTASMPPKGAWILEGQRSWLHDLVHEKLDVGFSVVDRSYRVRYVNRSGGTPRKGGPTGRLPSNFAVTLMRLVL